MRNTCEFCGKGLKPKSHLRKFCSDKCKMRAYRYRLRNGVKIGTIVKDAYLPYTHCNNFNCKMYLANTPIFFNEITRQKKIPLNIDEYKEELKKFESIPGNFYKSYEFERQWTTVWCKYCLHEHYVKKELVLL